MSPILDSIGSVKAFGWGSFAATNPVGSYDSLATITLSTSTASITFSGIPQTGYQHLQLRGILRYNKSDAAGQNFGFIRFNDDSTSANYASHYLFGDGSSASAGSTIGTAQGMFCTLITQSYTGQSNMFASNIIDILDYTSTTKYKTLRSLVGNDVNGSGGGISLTSGLWLNTNAITSITLTYNTGFGSFTLSQYSQIALYGIRG